ncbi:MAG: hypothetical protein O3A63_10195 [Proteobacteria bacterium]|nr:hypothetical protein [Pseudomonadota bacterium]
MFEKQLDFVRMLDSDHFAGFTVPSLQNYRLLLSAEGHQANNVAFHEYAHYLFRIKADQSWPLWYEEGLATYLGDVLFNTKKRQAGPVPAQLGVVQEDFSGWQRMNAAISYKDVLTTRNIEDWSFNKLSAFYRKSWALVHYLRLGIEGDQKDRDVRIHAYLTHMPADFAGTFGLQPQDLNGRLRRYLNRRQIPDEDTEFNYVPVTVLDSNCLNETQRDLELAISIAVRNPDLAEKILLDRMPENPTSDWLVALSEVQLTHDEDLAFQTAQQATTQNPDDPAARIQYATQLLGWCVWTNGEGCADLWRQATPLYRSALRQDPDRFDAALGLGFSYLHTGQPGDAINYLKVAYQKIPWAAQVNFFLGEAYRIVGDTRARQHLANAEQWARIPAWQARAELALAKLDVSADL